MNKKTLKEKVHSVIFEAETSKGHIFDMFLLCMIIGSVAAVMIESVDSVKEKYGTLLLVLEWVFTIVFSIEYIVRLWVVKRPKAYAKSFFGVVDLLSCLPTYIGLFFPGTHSLLVIRILRLLRMFRVMKMVNHIEGGDIIMRALYKSRAKIFVFFMTVVVFSVIAGTVMYLVEGSHNDGYANIPQSIYWAIVTISTVGYGDVSPTSALGKVVATLTMLSTYAIIAVPTGIVAAELSNTNSKDTTTDACKGCGVHGHLEDAKFCRSCGSELD